MKLLLLFPLDSIRGFLGFTVYILLCYALPHLLFKFFLRRHYKDWVKSGAYWRRSYPKFIIKGRIFYRDELWHDVVGAALCGVIFGTAGTIVLFYMIQLDSYYRYLLILPSVAASFVLLLVSIIVERITIIDDEISRLKRKHKKEIVSVYDL